MSQDNQRIICVPDDLRNKKQKVLLTFQETEDEIDRVSKKLKEIAKVYTEFGEKLFCSPTTDIYKVGAETHGHTVEQYDLRDFVTLGNPQAAFDLADELRKAKKKLRDLIRQKQELGLR